MHQLYLGLGTNLGDKEKNISLSIEKIEAMIGAVVRRSSLYATKPWGFRSDHDFLNACVCVETMLSPRQVLEKTQEIERAMGRTQKSHNGEYHDRIIDIDILLYDDLHVDEPDLKIPHPLMQERDFVMVPLREIKASPPTPLRRRGGVKCETHPFL